MRLQLITIFCLLYSFIQAQQEQPPVSKEKKVLNKSEVDFLFSYYHQEGNNSAVTGGLGTEKLSDYASSIIITVPTKPTREFTLEHTMSYYTSASSDNINPTTISSASSDNLVHKVNLTEVYKDTARNSQFGFKLGGTHQNNFGGFSLGTFYSKQSHNKNREFKVQASYTLDKWALYYHISKLYPYELKGQGRLVSTDKRYSYNLSLAYKQILTPKMQIQLASEVIYQYGLLSTPFHRVYFQEQTMAKLEKLPGHRLRLPLTFRLNYYAFDRLLIRSLYRYYVDSYGLQAHTINLELPFKITNFFSIYPFTNYHTQTAIRYFNGYKEHLLTEKYYTSDYDLSTLWSIEYGGGFYYSPVNNIFYFKKGRNFALKKWEMRYAYYKRSTGLHASIITTHFGFIF